MEMFREPQQESLDRWVRGEMTELEFLKDSRWYENWNSDFGYYRDILNFAREKRIDVLALNPSRDLQRQLAAGGGEVPPDLAGRIPESGLEDPYQRRVIQAPVSQWFISNFFCSSKNIAAPGPAAFIASA